MYDYKRHIQNKWEILEIPDAKGISATFVNASNPTLKGNHSFFSQGQWKEDMNSTGD